MSSNIKHKLLWIILPFAWLINLKYINHYLFPKWTKLTNSCLIWTPASPWPLVTSDLIEQPSVPLSEVSIIPKHSQQRHIHVFRETTCKRSREQVLLILSYRLKLDKAVIRKLGRKREICFCNLLKWSIFHYYCCRPLSEAFKPHGDHILFWWSASCKICAVLSNITLEQFVISHSASLISLPLRLCLKSCPIQKIHI